MSAPAIDQAAWASTWRRRSPGDKVFLAGGLTISALVLPAWPTSPVVALTGVVLALGPAGVPARTLARAARGPFLFIVLGTLSIAVTWRSGDQGFGPTVTDQSLRAAAVTVAHALAGTCAVLLLAATTPMTDLLGWMRRKGVPDAVVDVAGLVYRLLFVLLAATPLLSCVSLLLLARVGKRQAARMPVPTDNIVLPAHAVATKP